MSITYRSIVFLLFQVLVLAARALSEADSPQETEHIQQRVTYDFGKGIWPENIILRHDGRILGGLLTTPQIFEIDPICHEYKIVHTFEERTGVFGFAETEPDLFYTFASNFSLRTFEGVEGSADLYELDFRSRPQDPTIRKVMDFPAAAWFDGLATLNGERGLLVTGDSEKGEIHVIDIHNRTSTIVYSNSLLRRTPSLGVGIDGIKVHDDGCLYFTNAAQMYFGRLPMYPDTGLVRGEIEVLFNLTTFNISSPLDDFIFHPNGSVYLTVSTLGLAIAHPPDYSIPEMVVPVNGPTAVRLKKSGHGDLKLFYASTGNDFAFPSGNFVNDAVLGEINVPV